MKIATNNRYLHVIVASQLLTDSVQLSANLFAVFLGDFLSTFAGNFCTSLSLVFLV